MKSGCVLCECDLWFEKQTMLLDLGAVSGAFFDDFARITTPFILERANPSKDGDAKLWALGRGTV